MRIATLLLTLALIASAADYRHSIFDVAMW